MTTAKKELFFTPEEFQSRIGKVRQLMAQRDIDTLLVFNPENIYYLTGYQTFGTKTFMALAVPVEGQPIHILRRLESILAQRYSWVEDIAVFEDTDNPVEVTLKAIKERGYKGRIGVEETSLNLPVRLWRYLAKWIPAENYVDGSGLVEECRKIKSPAEIEYMREAAKQTSIGIAAAIDEAREGITENDIAARAMEAMTRAGAEYFPLDPIVTSGDRSGVPHSTYMRRVIRKGDTILLEFSGCYHRYNSPLMRTIVIGQPKPIITDMYNVCNEGLQAAIDAIKPGVTAGEVDAACRNIIVKAGYYENFRKRTGYSVGCSFPTDWGEGHIISIKENDKTILKPGMVFHMPPSLRLYHEACVGVSETVVVTEKGCDILAQSSRDLVIK
jgi:Xaa-Pro dipeptidase